MVLGHSKCGAITGACNHVEMGHLTTLLKKIEPAMEMEKTVKENRNGDNMEYVLKVTDLNVIHTIDRIRKESQIIADLEKEKKIKIVGGIYDVDNGTVTFFD
jgi:carbonic anhydrase